MRTEPGSPRRLGFIDALRGWAFVAVLCYHASQHHFGGPLILKLTRHGKYGVQLFYVISAATLFLSCASRGPSDRYPQLAFFIRRFFRIAPMFWLALGFYLWWDGMGPHFFAPSGIGPKEIAMTAVFAHGWSPGQINAVVPGGWSVGVEMSFYLLVPLLFSVITTPRRAAAFFIGMLLAGGGVSHLVNRMLLKQWPPNLGYLVGEFTYFWLPTQIPVFALGIVLYFLLRRESARPQVPGPHGPTARDAAWLLLSCASLVVVGVFLGHNPVLKQHVAYGMAFVLLAWRLAVWPAGLFVNRVIQYIGKVSFSAYLAQFFVLDLSAACISRFGHLAGHGGNGAYLVLFFSGFAGTVAIASLCHHFVELPGQRLGKALIAAIDRSAPLLDEAAMPADAVS